MLTATMLSLFPYFLSLLPSSSSYDLVREYSGPTFFDRWDFYGSWDNLTLGVLARISTVLPAHISPQRRCLVVGPRFGFPREPSLR